MAATQSESEWRHTIVCIYCTELGSRSAACPQEDLGMYCTVQMSSLSFSLIVLAAPAIYSFFFAVGLITKSHSLLISVSLVYLFEGYLAWSLFFCFFWSNLPRLFLMKTITY